MSTKTATARKVWLPKHGQWVHFTHRDTMRRKRLMEKASLAGHTAPPATTLPVDCTGNETVSCPMLGNNQYGDCGPVMCAHVDQIRTYGQGKPGFAEMSVNQDALVAQYEKVSGGDNGTDEDMLVGSQGIWTPAGGGIAGDATAVVADHLDVDVTDVALTQYCLDQFYAVNMAWSVPDAFLQGFAQGTVWPSAAIPDPNNGHFTPLADVGGPNDVDNASNGTPLAGFYRVWTWGAWAWVSPAFVASVDPECFVTFSALQFNKTTGYDSHGRHVSDQAAAWVAIGGNAQAVAPIVASFPPKAAAPAAAPGGGVTLTQAQSWASAGIAGASALLTKEEAGTLASQGLAEGWPKA